MVLHADFFDRFQWEAAKSMRPPFAVAHRGASDHAVENTLKAFDLAADLQAEMWELDVRMSADGVCMVNHDATLARVAGVDLAISESTAAEIRAVPLPEGQWVPTLKEVITLAKARGCGLYVELKDAPSAQGALAVLRETSFRFAVIGAFDPEWVVPLRKAGCEYPLSVLVPKRVDPLDYAAPAQPDIIHLCWLTAGDRPDLLVTEELIARIAETGAEIVTWHEDRSDVIAGLKKKPILGICSNRPEVLKG